MLVLKDPTWWHHIMPICWGNFRTLFFVKYFHSAAQQVVFHSLGCTRAWGRMEEPHAEPFAIVKEPFTIQFFPSFHDWKRFFLPWTLDWHITTSPGCKKYWPFYFFFNRFQLFYEANFLTLSQVRIQGCYWKFSNVSFSNFSILWIQVLVNSSGGIYRRCYFCLSQLSKIKKESTANTFYITRSR